MKRYYIYMMVMAVTALSGCTVDPIEKAPQMTPAGSIEVTYSVNGVEVEAIPLTSGGHEVTVDVTINNPGVYWTPVSDQPWCKVVEEEHYGNGSFKLNIEANEDFYDRTDATITFKVGGWSENVLKISQSGASVKVSGSYAIFKKGTETAQLELSTPDGYELETSDWITTTVDSVTEHTDASGGTYNTIRLNITAAENTAESRYGHVYVKRQGFDEILGSYHVWQYGTDVDYDEAGNILIPAQEAAPFEVRFPAGLVETVNYPEWATPQQVDNGDNSVSWFFDCEDNPSDAFHVRPMGLSLVLAGTETVIDIPFVKQQYYSVSGIISGRGLALLAKTYNEGGDCSEWQDENGKFVVCNDIDMSEITDWTPIGTSDAPFTGEFDGNHMTISNFKSSQPFFGYCSGATISNFVFDTSCELKLSGDVSTNQFLATLATRLQSGTTVDGCVSSAKLLLDGMKATKDIKLYVGGLAAISDAETTIRNSKFFGSIANLANSSTSTATTSQGTAFVGGIAGHVTGTVESCTFGGSMSHESAIKVVYTGGIAGYAESGSVLSSNKTDAEALIDYKSMRKPTGFVNDASRTNYGGGIVGITKGKVSDNRFEGTFRSDSNIKISYYGGIVGCIFSNAVVCSNNSTTADSRIIMTGAARYLGLGGLVGLIDPSVASYSLDFTNDTGVFEGEISGGSATDGFASGYCYIGGIIGKCEASLTLTSPKWNGYIDVNCTSDEELKWANLAAGGVVGGVVKYDSNGNPGAALATITGAEVTGKVTASGSSAKVGLRIFMGGIVGWNYSGLNISGSNFSGEVEWTGSVAKSNGYISVCGGIVGGIETGNSSITDCNNSGEVFNWHWNNNGPNNAGVTPLTYNYTGGIIGTYGYTGSPSGQLKINKCTCTSYLATHRGGVGGIAGYLAKAEVKDCSFTGGIAMNIDLGKYNCFYGGIVSTATDGTAIADCLVKADMSGMYAGSCPLYGGGIAAMLQSGSTVSGCKYYGNVDMPSPATDRNEYCGGLVGHAQSGTSVTNCRYGGYVRGSRVNTDALAAQYAMGTATLDQTPSEGTATGIAYWDGK